MDLKINEKAAIAQKQFMEKASKLIDNVKHERQLEEVGELCANEYTKLFGRFGTQPLLAVKGGKKAPRYLLDRNEVFVIYKPPLWQMGANPVKWDPAVKKLVGETKSLEEAQRKMLEEKKPSILQEWHGLTVGLRWIVPQDEDYYRRPVKDWGFIQRLDLETDGPVITAKTWRAQRMLQVQLKEHIFSKAYMCLVHGKLENRTQAVVCKFAELGGTEGTQIMLKYDNLNDPFYSKHYNGQLWSRRHVRQAKTFLKPIAYYKKKDDGTEYTLVYVNILSGITHQVRITLQSLGHPLVSDDRYLPREQAMADCQWCPRNFLSEVRADWFDMCGPYKNPERRRFERISVENPLPQLFQDILEKKLTLVQKLDPSADLYQGCQYWALGDEQLMADHPKDTEYRKKVMRWGIRRGIHLDALDRLLLFSREDVDRIMAEYKPPAQDEAFWVCPECMNLNHPDKNSGRSGQAQCGGFGFLHRQGGGPCQGKPKVPRNTKLPDGWRDYLADPTIHLIWILNPKLLDARLAAIQKSRPSWDRPPTEEEGDKASEEQIKSLFDALVQDAKLGRFGLDEEEVKALAGFENARMPLCLPPDCPLSRVRLPGRGTGSRWRYTLKGKERLKVAANISVKLKRLSEPILVDTDVLPEKAICDEKEEEKPAPRNQWVEEAEPARPEPPVQKDWVKEFQARMKSKETKERQKRQRDQPDPPPEEPDYKRQRPRSSYESYGSAEFQEPRYAVPAAAPRAPQPPQVPATAPAPAQVPQASPARVTRPLQRPTPDLPEGWEQRMSSQHGKFYYINTRTQETTWTPPPRVANVTAPRITNANASNASDWHRRESTKYPGKFYFQNFRTGETKWEQKSERN